MDPLTPTDPLRANAADGYALVTTYGRALPAFAEERGVDLGPLAAAAGLEIERFQVLDDKLSLDRFARLLEALAVLLDDPALGLRYAERYPLAGSGPYGYGIANAPTMREMLRFMVRYIGVNIDLSVCDLEIDGREARISWAISPLIVRCEVLNDLNISLVCRHLRAIAPAGWRPKAIALERGPPGRGDAALSTLYRNALSPRLTFRAPINAIIVDARDLACENRSADPILFEMMRARCRTLLDKARPAEDLPTRVREEAALMFGASPVTIDRVATRLGMSERTLQRRLAQAGCGFQELVDLARREISTRLLRETDAPIAEIARRLGFSAQSSYTRSALRWYGKPPTEMRGA